MTEPHEWEIRVYYEDTDFSGNVYHAAFLKFFERARTEWLRAHGVNHAELARQGRAFAVRRLQVDFAAPAHIDDLLRIETDVVSASGARLTLRQRLYRQETLLVAAEVEVVAISAAGRPVRLPPLGPEPKPH